MYPGIPTTDAMTPQQAMLPDFRVMRDHPKLLSVLSLRNCPDVVEIVLERKRRDSNGDHELARTQEAFGLDAEMFHGLVIAPKEHPHYNKCFFFRSVDFEPAADRVLIENGHVIMIPTSDQTHAPALA